MSPKTATSPTGKYGLLDTQDRAWMGNAAGPLRYDEWDFARMAAAICNEQMGWDWTRVRAALYQEDAKRLKDVVDTKCTPLEAIKRLEGGAEKNV